MDIFEVDKETLQAMRREHLMGLLLKTAGVVPVLPEDLTPKAPWDLSPAATGEIL